MTTISGSPSTQGVCTTQTAARTPQVVPPDAAPLPYAGDTYAPTESPGTMATYEAAVGRAQLDLIDKNQQAIHNLPLEPTNDVLRNTMDWLDDFDTDSANAQTRFDQLSPAAQATERQKAAVDPNLHAYNDGDLTPAAKKK